MMKRLILISILFCFIILAGCAAPAATLVINDVPEGVTAVDSTLPDATATADISSPATIAAESNDINTALSLMPGNASQFAFTHWSRLKRFHRVPTMTSVSENREDRTWFMLKVLKGSQAASAMDKAFFRYQAENWGWDSTDLQWEAEGQFDNIVNTVYLLRFRSDFDFAPLIALLNSLEFQTSQYGGVTIYSVPLTTDVLWSDRSNLAHHNIALLADEGLLVMSPMVSSVQQVLDIRQGVSASLADLPRVQRVAYRMEEMASARIYLGEETCQQFSPYNQERGHDIGSAQIEQWPVQPYLLLALGHALGQDTQTDLLMVYYQDYQQAEVDFPLRKELLVKGQSPLLKTPYSQQFVLEDAELEDALLIYTLIPSPTLPSRPGWPQTLVGWAQKTDALFAACQIEGGASMSGIR